MWSGDAGLVVAVGGSDDDLELFTRRAGVGGSRRIDGRTPERALEVGLRWWVRAVLAPDCLVAWVVGRVVVGRVERWITLGVAV